MNLHPGNVWRQSACLLRLARTSTHLENHHTSQCFDTVICWRLPYCVGILGGVRRRLQVNSDASSLLIVPVVPSITALRSPFPFSNHSSKNTQSSPTKAQAGPCFHVSHHPGCPSSSFSSLPFSSWVFKFSFVAQVSFCSSQSNIIPNNCYHQHHLSPPSR